MQVVILAGGLGTRLWPLTKERPKPMVLVRGVPYLEHQIRLLAQQGLRDVVLLTGYLGEQIQAYFEDGHRLNVKIRYSRERTPVGTGGALRGARGLLADRFVVLYGDSFLPIDYRPVIGCFHEHYMQGLVVVYRDTAALTGVEGNISLDDNGLVTTYCKTTGQECTLEYIDAGVQIFRRSVLDLIPSIGPVSMEREVFPRLVEQRALFGVPVAQRFYDIGTPDRLKVLEAVLR